MKIPDNLPLDGVAPLLCAGITLYSPIKHWKVKSGMKVAVMGLGGLDAIDKIPLPAIAHVVVQQQLHHYVVIYSVGKDKIEIMDPAYGIIMLLR